MAITVTDEVTVLGCAQCGRPAPADRSLLDWRHSALLTRPVDELLVMMLLCPDCVEDDLAGDFESGALD